MSKHQPIPGVRLKVRTRRDEDESLWAVASVWFDDEQRMEFATVRIDPSVDASDPRYHAWVDAVSALFNANIERITGIKGIVTKRQAPRYKGE